MPARFASPVLRPDLDRADVPQLLDGPFDFCFCGQRIDRDHSLAKELQKNQPGDTVQLKVMSEGEEKIIEATLAELED